MKLKHYLRNRPFLNIGSEISEITEDFKIELKEFYDLKDSENNVKIIGFKDNLLKRFIDTIYRDFILVHKNLDIYNSIDVRLFNGGKTRQCEFLELIRDNSWTKVIILSYGLFSNSNNDFYTYNNLIKIIECNFKTSLEHLEKEIRKIQEDQDSFLIIKDLRNKIYAHRDSNFSFTINRNNVISPLLVLGEKILTEIILISKIFPFNYSIKRNLHDYNGECIWSQIDLGKLY